MTCRTLTASSLPTTRSRLPQNTETSWEVSSFALELATRRRIILPVAISLMPDLVFFKFVKETLQKIQAIKLGSCPLHARLTNLVADVFARLR